MGGRAGGQTSEPLGPLQLEQLSSNLFHTLGLFLKCHGNTGSASSLIRGATQKATLSWYHILILSGVPEAKVQVFFEYKESSILFMILTTGELAVLTFLLPAFGTVDGDVEEREASPASALPHSPEGH